MKLFYVACTRLYKPLGRSVGPSVHLFIARSVADCSKHETYGDRPCFSHQYGLTRLKLQCEGHLVTMMSVTSVCEILIIADLHQSENLKKEAMQYLVNNAKEARKFLPNLLNYFCQI